MKSKSPDRFAKGAASGSVPHARVVFINHELARALEHDAGLVHLLQSGLCCNALTIVVCGRDSGHDCGFLQFFAPSQPLQRSARLPFIHGVERREARNEY